LELFGQLGETIVKDTVGAPADVAEELKPNTKARKEFLESAIERAKEFETKNHSKFVSWEDITFNPSTPTNSILANNLAELANKDVINFFTILDQFPTSLDEVCQPL
jgi:hypothetical protein